MSLMGSIASIPRCPPHVRLAGNFGHAGWLLIALDHQWYMPYWSSNEVLLDAMLCPARSEADGPRARPAASSG